MLGEVLLRVSVLWEEMMFLDKSTTSAWTLFLFLIETRSILVALTRSKRFFSQVKMLLNAHVSWECELFFG